MAMVPNSSTSSSREAGTGSVRRKLLTTRASTSGPPRVVLHLPDLDALATVSVGQPKRGDRRRVDTAHAASVAAPHRERNAEADDDTGREAQHLVRNILGHVEKLSGRAVTGGSTLVQIAALLQKPKVMAAGVAALGLQLAALLAMFLGDGKPADGTSANQAKTGNGGPAVVENRPSYPGTEAIGGIQTPLSAPPELLHSQGGPSLLIGPGTNAGSPRLSSPQSPSPTIVAQPNLPPLPRLNGSELPPWDAHENFVVPPGPQFAAPALPPYAPAATGTLPVIPARPGPAESATLNAPSIATENSRGPSPAVGSQSILSLPSMPSSDGARSTPALPVSQPGNGRPKARLNGTIQKVSSGGGST